MNAEDLDRIVEDNKNLVFRLILRLVGDRNVHDELFQEVFLNVFRSLPGFRGGSKLSTWIASITIHVCHSHLRKTAGRRIVSLDRWLEDNGGDPAPAAGGEEDSSRSENRADLEMHLDRLPPKYRIPLWLFYFEGQGYEDIAATMKIPLGTVKIRLFRGLRQLRASMKGERP